jgi:triacylglycerol esterase/lipase EstA (alpha/beta hydrolase family)
MGGRAVRRIRFPSALVALLLLVVFVRAAQAQTADYRRPPVLLIHGYFVVDQAGTFTWSPFKKKLIADGWPEEYLYAPSFEDVTGCNEDHVDEIEAWVEAIRKKEKVERIDIVCHSFGCLNALTWLKQRCGVQRVRQFVGLAGAMHGTRVACVDPFTCAAEQMCIPLFGDDTWTDNALLVAVHGCDETPGDVMYTSIWSEWDEIIRPPSGSILAGARNIEVDTALVGHAGIFMVDESYAAVKEALLGAGGLNEDGPGWDCLPEACRPAAPEPEPEPVPEPVDVVEPTPEIVEPRPDGATADHGTADDRGVPEEVGTWDRGVGEDSDGVVEVGFGDPGRPDSDPGSPAPARGGGSCAAAGGSAHAAGAWLLTSVVLGWAWLRRRTVP